MADIARCRCCQGCHLFFARSGDLYAELLAALWQAAAEPASQLGQNSTAHVENRKTVERGIAAVP